MVSKVCPIACFQQFYIIKASQFSRKPTFYAPRTFVRENIKLEGINQRLSLIVNQMTKHSGKRSAMGFRPTPGRRL